MAAPVMILPDLKAVLQWRQDCVQQITSQCCVHESVAVLLLDKHQGSAANACTAWANRPQGIDSEKGNDHTVSMPNNERT